jgi:hypothetical protein
MPILTCPSCGTRLTVSPSAPRRLTCPRCLAPVENPAAGQRAPLPVIPLDEQVQRDTRISDAGVVVICVLVLVGVLTLLSAAFVPAESRPALRVMIGFMVAGTIVGAWLVLWKPKQTQSRTDDTSYPPDDASASPILHYRRGGYEQPKLHPMRYLGQAIGGIILGIVTAVGLTVLFQNTPLVAGAIFAPAAVGIGLMFVPRVRGLAMGLILAVPVAGLLLVGLCFAALSGAVKF